MRRGKRRATDPMIALVNIVFLLVAFLLFPGFRKPAPVAVNLPVSTGATGQDYGEILYIDKNAILYFREHKDDEAWGALSVWAGGHGTEMETGEVQTAPLLLAIDGRAKANKIAGILSKIDEITDGRYVIETRK